MLRSYSDILQKINEKPKWWDKNGTPRYCEFSPENFDVYIDEAALIEIACQGCGEKFDVEITHEKYHPLEINKKSLFDQTDSIGYGDPPRNNCCSAGPTMSSIPLQIKQFWKRENGKWFKKEELFGKKLESLEDYFGEDNGYF
jgi:hypothetical protein